MEMRCRSMARIRCKWTLETRCSWTLGTDVQQTKAHKSPTTPSSSPAQPAARPCRSKEPHKVSVPRGIRGVSSCFTPPFPSLPPLPLPLTLTPTLPTAHPLPTTPSYHRSPTNPHPQPAAPPPPSSSPPRTCAPASSAPGKPCSPSPPRKRAARTGSTSSRARRGAGSWTSCYKVSDGASCAGVGL